MTVEVFAQVNQVIQSQKESVMGKVCSVLSGRPMANLEEVVTVVKAMEHQAEEAGLPGLLNRSLTPSHTAVKQQALTGRRRSLLMGCNYLNTSNELHGCANDVRRMIPVLKKMGFASDDANQMLLLDEETWERPQAHKSQHARSFGMVGG